MATVRSKLDRANIVDQALVLLDEKGFDALSLRALATRLGVQAPALYWHFADRGALLTAMVETIDSSIAVPRLPPSRTGLYDWIVKYGQAWRATLLSVRDSTRLMAEATASSALSADYYALAHHVEGLNHGEVAHIVSIVNSYVLGWTHYEQQPEMRKFMEGMMEVDSAFVTGLRALGQGLITELKI